MGILGAVVFTLCFKSLSQLTSVMIQEIPFYYPTCQALSYFASNTYLLSVQILTYFSFKNVYFNRKYKYITHLEYQVLLYLNTLTIVLR